MGLRYELSGKGGLYRLKLAIAGRLIFSKWREAFGAVNPFKKGEVMFGTIGPVIDGVEIKIADDGEILTRGPHVIMGYYNEPEMTAEIINFRRYTG